MQRSLVVGPSGDRLPARARDVAKTLAFIVAPSDRPQAIASVQMHQFPWIILAKDQYQRQPSPRPSSSLISLNRHWGNYQHLS